MRSKARKESKFTRCIDSLIRALANARDFYVKSMLDCAGPGGSIAMGCPLTQVLPRSFSLNTTSSKDEDYRELLRAAYSKSLENKIDLEIPRRHQVKPSPVGGVTVMARSQNVAIGFSPSSVSGVKVLARSQSVAIGKIDEDKPCEFGEDVIENINVIPRSKSSAVSRRRGLA